MTPEPCGHCEWCRFTLSLYGRAYASVCIPRKAERAKERAEALGGAGARGNQWLGEGGR